MPTDPEKYIVGPDTEASDIDLDTEVFVLRDGRRLTNELAEQLAAEALANPPAEVLARIGRLY